jgi:outer membrane receptor for ferrienterochelin and colicins
MKAFFTVTFLISAASIIFSQGYSISGKITSAAGEPLEFVNIILDQTNIGASSNSLGEYKIENVPAGNYVIQASMIGYKTYRRNVRVYKDVVLNMKLNEEIIQQEQIVVTAGKHEQIISELPVSAEIMQGDFLLRNDFTNLRDAIGFVAGVNMVDDQISIRGSSGYSRGAGTRVLVALDGIPIYTGDTGEIIWESIPINQIERIEVIKGAASSLYGSTAVGGVVNVITKRISETPQTYIKTQAGFYDKPAHQEWRWTEDLQTFYGFTAAHSRRFGKLGLSLSLTKLGNEGYRLNGNFDRYLGYLKASVNINETSSMSLFFNSINQKSGYFIYWKDAVNALVPPDGDRDRTVESNRYMTGLTYNNLMTDDLSLTFNLSYYNTEWTDESVSKNEAFAELVRGETQINFQLLHNLILVSGVELTSTKIKSNLFGDPVSFTIGGYAHTDYKISAPLLLSAGARFDYVRLDTLDGAGAAAPKIGLNYKLSDQISFRTSAGFGFRAPSLAEAFTSTIASGISIKPNRDIKPERNFNAEAGVNYRLSENISFDAAFFQNEFFDFIEPRLTADAGGSYIIFANVQRARILGTEVNSNFIFNSLQLNLNYTHLYSRDLEENITLKYRPSHSATLNAVYNFNLFELGTNFRYWSKVDQMDFEVVTLNIVRDGRKRVPVYILDFFAGYNFNNIGIPGRLIFNAKNVLNYNYVELIANLAPIRHYSLSMELFF